MNSYQKAILLLGLTILPLVLLFMSAMHYPGVGLTATAWLASMTALVYALRTVDTGAPRWTRRPGNAVPTRLHADSRYRRFKARGLR